MVNVAKLIPRIMTRSPVEKANATTHPGKLPQARNVSAATRSFGDRKEAVAAPDFLQGCHKQQLDAFDWTNFPAASALKSRLQ
jgi:hypothetical protein